MRSEQPRPIKIYGRARETDEGVTREGGAGVGLGVIISAIPKTEPVVEGVGK